MLRFRKKHFTFNDEKDLDRVKFECFLGNKGLIVLKLPLKAYSPCGF